MINSRDSYSEYNPNKKESIDVPFCIGTIIVALTKLIIMKLIEI